MLTSDFNFDLPEDLIAQHPSGVRGQDKLMLLNRATGEVEHHMMDDLPDLIEPGTLMIFNNSRVRRARVYGIKETTGRETEFMFLNTIDKECCIWNTMVKSAKKQKPGMHYKFPDGTVAEIVEHEGNAGTEFRALKFDFAIDEDWFERNGHIPLPPYIKRGDTDEDSERYQNVYATDTGSAACPTAGLHFTERVLANLDACEIDREELTLHVGAGTFKPVKSEEIGGHEMHTETISVRRQTFEKLLAHQCQAIAVGTTSVRTLESLYYMGLKVIANPEISEDNLHVGQWEPYELEDESRKHSVEECLRALVDYMDRRQINTLHSSTQIIIVPGYKYKIVKMLITNFHQPQSTLLLLVSAFVSGDWKKIYDYALSHDFRFLSYGDSSLLIP